MRKLSAVILTACVVALVSGRVHAQPANAKPGVPMPMPAPASGAPVNGAPVNGAPATIQYHGAPANGAYGAPAWCGSGCCESCCDNCGGGCQSGGWNAGIGFYLVDPHQANDTAFTVSLSRTEIGSARFGTASEQLSFDTEFVPIVWAGYSTGDGFGARIRAWWFDTDAASAAGLGAVGGNTFVTITSGGPPGALGLSISTTGSSLAVNYDYDQDVYDFEAIMDGSYCNLRVTYVAGLRWFRAQENFSAYSNSPLLTTRGASVYSREYEGIGPLAGIEVRYPLMCGLNFFSTTRVAGIYGHDKRRADRLVTTEGGEISGSTSTFATLENTKFQVQGEIEVGAEWSGEMAGSNVFFRTTLVSLANSGTALTGLGLVAGISR